MERLAHEVAALVESRAVTRIDSRKLLVKARRLVVKDLTTNNRSKTMGSMMQENQQQVRSSTLSLEDPVLSQRKNQRIRILINSWLTAWPLQIMLLKDSRLVLISVSSQMCPITQPHASFQRFLQALMIRTLNQESGTQKRTC